MKRNGRPRRYTDEDAEEVLQRIAAGESLRSISKDPAMPAASTINLWVINDEQGFSARYKKARQAQAMLLADELMGIADDEDSDVNRARLRVDTRKWYLGKVIPKVYGDRSVMEHANHDGRPVAIEIVRKVVDPIESEP